MTMGVYAYVGLGAKCRMPRWSRGGCGSVGAMLMFVVRCPNLPRVGRGTTDVLELEGFPTPGAPGSFFWILCGARGLTGARPRHLPEV